MGREGRLSPTVGMIRDNFTLLLKGFLKIYFEQIKFEALAGSSPKLYPPSIKDSKFEGCLAYPQFRYAGNNVVALPHGEWKKYQLQKFVRY